MSEFKSKIGKKILSILMFSMYSDAKTIYREYIQNASDAIKEAVDNGILDNIKCGHISINIDSESKTITITDNGTGIPCDKAEERLLNIADSIKDGVNEAGQFGIGRLVGAGYCQKLTFRTSSFGENKGTEIVFDVAAAEKIIADTSDTSTAEEVIDTITSTTYFDADESEHYFKVQMDDVHSEYGDLLNEETVRNYLIEVAPIDYKMEFKSQILQKNMPEEYSQYYSDLNSYQISLNSYNDIRKPYGLKIVGTDDKIEKLSFFKIENSKFGVFAWGWYAVTDFSKAIPTSDTSRGIRLRRHNIQVGKADKLNGYFKESRGNNYFYGEIHAIHKDLLLSSSRDGLAGSTAAVYFEKALKAKLFQLTQIYNFASKAKSAIKEIETTDAILDLETDPDKEQITSIIAKADEELNKLTNSPTAQSQEVQDIASIYRKKIDEVKQKAKSKTEGDIVFEEPEIKQEKKKIEPEKSKEDALSSIRAFYLPETIEVLEIAFEILDKCSGEKDKALISSLKKKIVKKLSK